ncbi:MAG: DEAD/DEAH box helicase family protein [Candidatus Dadabacteria bacterium]|nr:DEAD/DEAH box helicase family protein [Candidatus Dadabacteria bacterium]
MDASDPGTGKTRVALEAWFERYQSGGKKLLVLAPKSLMEVAWGDDIDKFLGAGVKYSVAYSTNRKKAFEAEADIYITNTDATKWLVKQPPRFFWKFDSLIIDESSYYKHRTSARSKAVNKIKKYFEYRACLSGTPNSNTITDIWHQIFILDDGRRLGHNFFKFRGAVCQPEQVGPQPQMVQWRDKPHAEVAVNDLIKDISIRHQFDECTDIPANTPRYIKYFLKPSHFVKYKEMEDTAILELEDENITAVNAAVVRQKLLQIASGAVYGSDDYKVLDDGRYELVMDLIQERKHSICFFNWRHQRDAFVRYAEARKLSYAVIDGDTPDHRRRQIVDAFQHGFYEVVFMHYRSGAHGLTLTKATATIWPSPIYEADYFKQGVHRVYRTTQTQKTENIMIEAVGTVEHAVYEILQNKTEKMINLLDLIKGNKDESNSHIRTNNSSSNVVRSVS